MSDHIPLTPIGSPDEELSPPQQSLPPPPPKTSNVKVWVFAAGVIAVFLGGYYVRNKVKKEAGLDLELMQKSGALAVTKVIVAANRDVVEPVSVDEERLITIRNKQTGETSTVSVNSTVSGDVSTGSAVFALPKDSEFFIGRDKVAQADIPARIREILKNKTADEQVIYIKSGKGVNYGTVVSVIDSIRDAGFDRIGLVAEKESSPKLPSWFPSYPGAVVHETLSTESKDGKSTSFGFSTNDSIEKVVKYYEDNLKRVRLKVTTNTVQQGGIASKGSLATEGGGKERTAFVTAFSEKGQTQVKIVFASK